MLRIMPNQPKAPPPGPATPPQGPTQGPPQDLLAAIAAAGGGPDQAPDGGADDDNAAPTGRYDAQKTSQDTAGYMGPEAGPFACGRCFHFDGKGACALVQGKIDPAGCCNLFEPEDNEDSPDEASQDPNEGQEPVDGPPEASGPANPPRGM